MILIKKWRSFLRLFFFVIAVVIYCLSSILAKNTSKLPSSKKIVDDLNTFSIPMIFSKPVTFKDKIKINQVQNKPIYSKNSSFRVESFFWSEITSNSQGKSNFTLIGRFLKDNPKHNINGVFFNIQIIPENRPASKSDLNNAEITRYIEYPGFTCHTISIYFDNSISLGDCFELNVREFQQKKK